MLALTHAVRLQLIDELGKRHRRERAQPAYEAARVTIWLMQLCKIVRVYAVMIKGGLSVTMERDELRRLVDELPENAARRYLEFIRDVGKDPVRFALENAMLDDEPETDEERERAKLADEDFRAGRTTSMDELKRELGL